MKIIKTSGMTTEVYATTTCRKCGCQFEFAKSEGKNASDYRDGDCVEINCPSCLNCNWVALTKFQPKPLEDQS